MAPCAARHRRSSSVVSRNIQPIKRPSLARVSPPPRLHRAARTSGRGRHRSRATRLRRLHRHRARRRHRHRRHRRRHRARRAVIIDIHHPSITHRPAVVIRNGRGKERVVASRDSSHDGKEAHPSGFFSGRKWYRVWSRHGEFIHSIHGGNPSTRGRASSPARRRRARGRRLERGRRGRVSWARRRRRCRRNPSNAGDRIRAIRRFRRPN